jgi:hypothetical protein
MIHTYFDFQECGPKTLGALNLVAGKDEVEGQQAISIVGMLCVASNRRPPNKASLTFWTKVHLTTRENLSGTL